MKKTGIIWKVDEPSKWVNSMAVLEKAYVELIICLNLRNLNKEKKKKHYQLQTFQKITRRLSGAKGFTKIDGNKGYWKIPLNEATLVVGLIWDYPSDWPDGITDPYFRPWFVKQQQKSAGWRESGAWDDGVIGLFFRA